MECIFFETMSVYFLIIKLKCRVKKNEHLRHLLIFALNHGSKAAKAANLYSVDFSQRGIENLVVGWEEVVDINGEYIIDKLADFIKPLQNQIQIKAGTWLPT